MSTLLRSAASDSSNVPRICLFATIVYRPLPFFAPVPVVTRILTPVHSVNSSTKPARNVVLCLFFGWICENLGRRTELD